jgi:hypothetical protein
MPILLFICLNFHAICYLLFTYVVGCIWCLAGSDWMSLGSKNAKSALQTRRNSLLAKSFQSNSPLAKWGWPPILLIGLMARVRVCNAVWQFSRNVFQLKNPQTSSDHSTLHRVIHEMKSMSFLVYTTPMVHERVEYVYSGSDELRMGMNVEPRHSLSRTRMLSMNPMYVKTRSD